MGYIEKTEKLNFLLEILKKGNCGDAACLAKRLKVSERTIKNYISTLRDLGNLIIYDPMNKSYFLVRDDYMSGNYDNSTMPGLKTA